jgi:hypothetical protein
MLALRGVVAGVLGTATGDGASLASTEPGSVPGLVSSSTSQNGAAIQSFDPSESRVKRLRKAVISAAAHLDEQWQSRNIRYRVGLVTLTYAPGEDWAARDISKLTDHYRKWAKRRGIDIGIIWTAEIGEKSGRFHYHLLLWLPLGYTPPKPDKQGWWSKGMSNCKWVRRPVAYVAKYAGKGSDGNSGTIPKGARLYGVLGLRGLLLIRWRWAMLPRWLRDLTREPMPVRRDTGGFWRFGVIRLRSPWDYLGLRDGKICLEWRGWAMARLVSQRGGVETWEHDVEVCGFAF